MLVALPIMRWLRVSAWSLENAIFALEEMCELEMVFSEMCEARIALGEICVERIALGEIW